MYIKFSQVHNIMNQGRVQEKYFGVQHFLKFKHLKQN